MRLAPLDQPDGFEHGLGAQMHEPIVQFAGRLLGTDRRTLLQNDFAGVHLGAQKERGDAGLRLAGHDGPVNGRGTPVARQQGGVQVEGAQPRLRVHLGRQGS